MVKDTGVDGAVVTTTPGTHFALAELALKGGKYGMSSASLLPHIYIYIYVCVCVCVRVYVLTRPLSSLLHSHR